MGEGGGGHFKKWMLVAGILAGFIPILAMLRTGVVSTLTGPCIYLRCFYVYAHTR